MFKSIPVVALMLACLAGCTDSTSPRESDSSAPTTTPSGDPQVADLLGRPVAIDHYSIRPPQGWVVWGSYYGEGTGSITWLSPNGSDSSVCSSIEFTVRLDPRYSSDVRPDIITQKGQHRKPGAVHTYFFNGAPPPTYARIADVEFTRMHYTQTIDGQSTTFDTYIANFDGASVAIKTHVRSLPDTELYQQVRAAALSFDSNSGLRPEISREQIQTGTN